MQNTVNRIGITLGDPAGVGPELIVKISEHFKTDKYAYIIYGEEKILKRASSLIGKRLIYEKIEDTGSVKSPGVFLVDLNLSDTDRVEPSVKSGKIAIAYLGRATADAIKGNVRGILTMPLNKFWAKKAGFNFEGQTEYLAHASNTKEFAMLMYSEEIKVVLNTTHIPLKEVYKSVKKEVIKRKVKLIDREFQRLFRFKPKIGVFGLNPHAGENGEIGEEDIKEILPAVEELKLEGFNVEGPLVPDTAFLNRNRFNVFLCMYHDQGLIPFKLLAFERGVNMTLGLPFIRTSPDHGTAYDIAWKGEAKETSSLEALKLIEKLLSS